MSKVLAIDPGDVESAFVLMDSETLEPLEFAKLSNPALAAWMDTNYMDIDEFVIERVQSYGMAVGKNVFRTCEWTGRFVQIVYGYGIGAKYVYRKDEKLHICHDSRAKDANIRRALIDRFATHDMKNGKGTKDNPDFFYKFKADCWAAYAVGLTYIEAGPSEVEES